MTTEANWVAVNVAISPLVARGLGVQDAMRKVLTDWLKDFPDAIFGGAAES